MSTIVCHHQNWISNCFETTTLKLTLTITFNNNSDVRTISDHVGNWGFIQTQTSDHCNNYNKIKETYPPKPGPRLTARSLDLCTENLGSETGTDDVRHSSTLFSSGEISTTTTTSFHELHNINATDFSARLNNTYRRRKDENCSIKTGGLPPPLTTMMGSNSLQLRRRIEDGGRLVIQAVETPFRNSYLEAERSDGRLRLRYFTPPPTPEPPSFAAAGEGEDGEEDDADADDDDECGGETAAALEIEGGGNETESENCNLEKFRQRLSVRCKEGSHCWKAAALWVATS
ncbi:protein FANTASTIC FOUR 3 [Andrographis paniculata]|uniref:protein FANTASTIC FOUR 3 n=1 Tax=Andrographis paniculata TaxID=175694 RepID=UPI0021E800B3|nr:protein FANTASTIC FOUR 3 [Andrographis paniculata]